MYLMYVNIIFMYNLKLLTIILNFKNIIIIVVVENFE